MTQKERAGLAFALAEILAVGLVPAFSKLAVSRIDPLLYSAAAVSVAALVACVLAHARGELQQVFQRGTIGWLVPIALLGTTATTLLLLFGARLTDGISTALLMQSEPIYSLLLTRIFWNRPAPARQLLGTALLLTAIVLVLYDGSFRIGFGGLLVLLVPLGWQLSHVLALRVMPPMSPYALTAARYLYGGAALVLLQGAFGGASAASLGWTGLWMAGFQGVVLFFCGTLFWYETIRRIDLSRATAIVTPCEPILSVVLVCVLLRTGPSLWQGLGLALTVPGMLMLFRTGRASGSLVEAGPSSSSQGAT